jgi:hypothetical protein
MADKQAADPADRPVASDAADITRVPNPGALPRKALGWLLWAGGGAAVAICIVILLMWGIHGPTYLFDLIAAYCL